MKTGHIGVALALALLGQTTLTPLLVGGTAPVDLVLVVVVFAALSRGPVVGLWTGTVGGLLQDTLSGGIIGVSGLTKTIAGVVVGVAASQFLLGTMWHRSAIVVLASIVHGLSYVGVYAVISPGGTVETMDMVIVQAVINATVGVAAEASVRAAPGSMERLRPGRRSFARRRWMTS